MGSNDGAVVNPNEQNQAGKTRVVSKAVKVVSKVLADNRSRSNNPSGTVNSRDGRADSSPARAANKITVKN